jgi:hypothetical protein
MFCANELGEAPFKLQDPGPHPALIGQDSAPQHLDRRINLFFSKKRLVDPDQFPQLFSLTPIFSTLRSLCLKELAQKTNFSEQVFSQIQVENKDHSP